MSASVFTGDCLLVMGDMADASVDSIVTDPPYGLGFMGKSWDNGVPGAEFWAEMLRVAKPGAYLLAFGGTRTSHRMACAIEDAGWEIRDTIMWLYGSGFPKSHNGPWGGTALKPAHEPIIMARKPLVGTVAANVLAYGTGGLNIDLCRVATSEDDLQEMAARSGGHSTYGPDDTNSALGKGLGRPVGELWTPNATGRWPANVIHDGSEEVLAAFPNSASPWIGNPNKGAKGGRMFGGSEQSITDKPEYRDAGSAARFFYCAKASRKDRNEGLEGVPLKPSGMVSNTSGQHITRRDGGAPAPAANNHPTVKPTALMRYLVRLVTPKGGTCLDPFCGSGSTGRAAVLEWTNFIGIDLEAEYTAIAMARIAHAEKEAA